jgi:predicted small metal-binding protein
MAYVVNCECGRVIRGETLDDVVEETTEHIRSDHPELAESVTRDDIESWAQLAP